VLAILRLLFFGVGYTATYFNVNTVNILLPTHLPIYPLFYKYTKNQILNNNINPSVRELKAELVEI
jgi:hypothetical protein